jgi:hypothetical protein
MDDWTPEQRAEWQARFSTAPPGSQERALLEDMQWTGVYTSTGASSPGASYVAAEQPASLEFAPSPPGDLSPPPPSPAPVPALPPLYPVPPPAQNPEDAVKKAQMNAFFDRKPQPTPAQMEDIRQKAMPPPAIPPGGVGAMGTRRKVFGRGGGGHGLPRPEPGPSRPLKLMISDLEEMIARNPKMSQRYNFPAALEQLKAKQARAELGIANTQTRRNVKLQGGRTRKSSKGGDIVSTFFNMREQIKLYHWQTRSFAEHKATDDLIGKLDTNIDTFVEVYMGRYGRPVLKRTLPVKNLTVTGIRGFINKSGEWLSFKLPRMVKKTDTDLLNIRDEILADLNQIKYLFTLA